MVARTRPTNALLDERSQPLKGQIANPAYGESRFNQILDRYGPYVQRVIVFYMLRTIQLAYDLLRVAYHARRYSGRSAAALVEVEVL